tara:strand:- start:31 stop:294 length:264 start_codon:yes stop_codon:yes gene_type:complete
MDDIKRMAREAGPLISTPFDVWCERFAELVLAKDRERIIAANAPEIKKINAHIKAIEAAVLAEREACAKVAEQRSEPGTAAFIRART